MDMTPSEYPYTQEAYLCSFWKEQEWPTIRLPQLGPLAFQLQRCRLVMLLLVPKLYISSSYQLFHLFEIILYPLFEAAHVVLDTTGSYACMTSTYLCATYP